MASIQTLDRGTRRERHAVRYKDEQGKHRSKTFRLKNEAKAFEAEATKLEERRHTLMRHGVDLGMRDRTTVLAHVEDWLARYSGRDGQLEESTRGKWRSAVNVGLRPHPAAHLKVSSLRPTDLQEVLDAVQAPSTRKTLHQALALALDDAVGKQVLASNPARGMKAVKVKRKRKPRAITDDHVTLLLASVPEPFRLMCELQLWTGARPGEAIAWWPCDLVTRNGRDHLRIVRAVPKNGRGYKSVKTGEDGEREIPLPHGLARRYRERVEELGLLPDAEQPMFPGANPLRPVDRANFTKRVWNRAVGVAVGELEKQKRATSGLEAVIWYDLRHTCVSRLIAKGADIVRVARWIGHTKPTTTLREYGHMFPQGLDELADLLAD